MLWRVLAGGYAEPGFDAVGDDPFEQSVLARIIVPTSKAAVVTVADSMRLPGVTIEWRMGSRWPAYG